MPTQDPPSGQTDPLAGIFDLPPVQKGDEVYDRIMGEIEPELISTSLPTLDQKYKNETPAEGAARQEKYKKAFEEYDKRYQEFCQTRDTNLHSYQRKAMASLEKDAQTEENNKLDDIESAISNL